MDSLRTMPAEQDLDGLDVMISKNGRALTGMCVRVDGNLWIKNEKIFREIPVDYTIRQFEHAEFIEYVKTGEFVLTSTPKVGDTVVWFSDASYYVLSRKIDEIIHTRSGDALIVQRDGVRQLVFVKNSAIFVQLTK
jgi:hypothetical protein